jgi:hypothetical protein
MMQRNFVQVIAFVAFVFIASSPSNALDLAEARGGGQSLALALASGDRGDWAGAEAIAARTGDPVFKDIVLWRKLRARAGTVPEYQSFISRRSTWPGRDALAQAVLGQPVAPERPEIPLTARAAENWRKFSGMWRARKYDDAEAYLSSVTGDVAALGRPGMWAERRQALARRAARQGRAEVAYLR